MAVKIFLGVSPEEELEEVLMTMIVISNLYLNEVL
jgi:hypothetical protein